MHSTDQQQATESELFAALAATPTPLTRKSSTREEFWLVVWSAVCTRGPVWARPMGSTFPQRVEGEDARSTEFVAAVEWLVRNEAVARSMAADRLFRMVRGVALRGPNGSARSARADALHGMTGVPAGTGVRFVDLIETAVA